MDIDSAIRRLNDNIKAIVGRMTMIEDRIRGLPLEGKGFWISFGPGDVNANNITTTNGIPYLTTVGKAMVVQSWIQSVAPLTTNNATNYWTLTLLQKLSGGSNNVVSSFNTSTYTVDVWTKATQSPSYALNATDVILMIQVTKTGAPGPLAVAGPMLYAS